MAKVTVLAVEPRHPEFVPPSQSNLSTDTRATSRKPLVARPFPAQLACLDVLA